MNEDLNQLEQRLRRQPGRPIPADWRADILAAAREAQPSRPAPDVPGSFVSILNQQFSAWLWPHPKAWGALAATWILIFVLHFAARDTAPVPAGRASAPAAEVMAELRQQQKLYAELLGVTDLRDADRPKDLPLRPRTERVKILSA